MLSVLKILGFVFLKKDKNDKNAFLPSSPFCKTIAKRIYFSTFQKNQNRKNPKMKIQNEKIQNEKKPK